MKEKKEAKDRETLRKEINAFIDLNIKRGRSPQGKIFEEMFWDYKWRNESFNSLNKEKD